MNSVGRNDPCPCGSGLKYKKCCLPRGDSVAEDSGGLQAMLAKGYKNMSDHNWGEAITIFEEALVGSGEPHSLLEAIAACYDGLENYLRAAEYYEKALTCCPSSKRFSINYNLGVVRACGNRLQKAEEAFQECLALGDTPEKTQPVLKILENLQSIKEGKNNSNLFLVQAQLQRAFSDMDSDRYESAASRLERLADMDPDNSLVFYNLGVVYTFLKDEERALTNFQKCVDRDPDFAYAYYNMGQINLIKRKDFSQALSFFDRAAAIRPAYVGAHHQRGVAYELLGNPTKAIECWEKTIELDPGNRQAQSNIERVQAAINVNSSHMSD